MPFIMYSACTTQSFILSTLRPTKSLSIAVQKRSVCTFDVFKSFLHVSASQPVRIRNPRLSTWRSGTSPPSGATISDALWSAINGPVTVALSHSSLLSNRLPRRLWNMHQRSAASPPGSTHLTQGTRSNPTAIKRRLEHHETDDDENALGAYLPDDDVDLIVNSIAQNQQASAVCIGCQMPGHTLTECNSFVDYIVAESLAQRHPTLRAQVANSHSHFRSRLNAANARTRLMQGGPASRTV